MKVVILAGGLGTRLMEETTVRPKPMVEVGGQPILRHIMATYSQQGFNEFVIALGYKGEMIKDYFLRSRSLESDLRIDFASNEVVRLATSSVGESGLRVELVDTGFETQTGGRLRRLESLLRPKGRFMLTYGDGVADVDLRELLAFHEAHGRSATLTAVRPPAVRLLNLDCDSVAGFSTREYGAWVNGGYFVFEPAVFDDLDDDSNSLEAHALSRLAARGELRAYRHNGFWQCMDTVHERNHLESLVHRGEAPWLQVGRACGMKIGRPRSRQRTPIALAATGR